MIYLKLLFSFLKIGLFAFGGAYGAIPLIRDVVLANGLADPAMFANLVALSEATPGPIMVNMATYIGSRQAGVLGAAAATFGVVLPSFLLLLIITVLFHNLIRHKTVQAILKGVKPCLMGVILATGLSMLLAALSGEGHTPALDKTACAIFFFLTMADTLYRKWKKSDFSPILLIILAAACGSILY